ncbi:MAG: transketolase, partial [Spirochaetota bacterium]|nr:transketolase [Spirochaetota bacterium]
MNYKDLKIIADSIRVLSMDAVQKAKSGHPGMPLGCADIAAVLWGKILKHNPADPTWINRDRFILSAGHGSMLLYSALHLSGYDVSLDDIKNFRQLGSKTPGHPEYCCTSSVEVTSGPLGQGFANAVGMAIARDLLANEFNITHNRIIDHYIYSIISDGDIMEGVSSEAASLAGHIGLGNLIFIYDYNNITIEGDIDLAFSEDIHKRFSAYNWHIQEINGHDFHEIES